MAHSQIANAKTTEVLTVKLQDNLYLSVVRGSFDIVIFLSLTPYLVLRIYDAAGNVIETHQHTGDFKEW